MNLTLCADFFTSSFKFSELHFQKFYNWILCYFLKHTVSPSHIDFHTTGIVRNTMTYRESYYEFFFYDIYTNNTSYYIHENIYMYLSYI